MTGATVPRHLWMHEVITGSGCTVEQAEPFRERLNRWYNAGERYDMAARDLKFMIKQSSKTFDDGRDAIRRAVLASTKL